MMKNRYAKAYTEVLEIIKYFPEDEYKKIPEKKIKFYKENMDTSYNFVINPQIDLEEQNISKEAYSIIISLFQDYFATENQKQKIKEILELNAKKSELYKQEKYNSNDLFKSKNKIENTDKIKEQETSLVEYKENFFSKFKKFILNLLHIN